MNNIGSSSGSEDPEVVVVEEVEANPSRSRSPSKGTLPETYQAASRTAGQATKIAQSQEEEVSSDGSLAKRDWKLIIPGALLALGGAAMVAASYLALAGITLAATVGTFVGTGGIGLAVIGAILLGVALYRAYKKDDSEAGSRLYEDPNKIPEGDKRSRREAPTTQATEFGGFQAIGQTTV